LNDEQLIAIQPKKAGKHHCLPVFGFDCRTVLSAFVAELETACGAVVDEQSRLCLYRFVLRDGEIPIV
jgi:hypothetical protein